jgi:hypothetical protein
MSKTLNRLVLALGIVASPMLLVGCSEGEKATPPAEPPKTEAPATTPAPGEAPTTPPATTPPAEAPK